MMALLLTHFFRRKALCVCVCMRVRVSVRIIVDVVEQDTAKQRLYCVCIDQQWN